MYRYVLFDLDGTLTDPGEGITNSVMHALRRMGIDPPEREALYPFIGPPLLESFAKYYGITGEDGLRAVAYYREYYRDRGIFENRVIEGIPALLEALTAAGCQCVLATAKPLHFAAQILEHYHLDGYFAHTAGASMDSSKTEKPMIVADALALCGAGAGEAVMVGDRYNDVEGAHANGIPCIGVLFGYGTRAELTEACADFIAEGPAAVRRLVLEEG